MYIYACIDATGFQARVEEKKEGEYQDSNH